MEVCVVFDGFIIKFVKWYHMWSHCDAVLD